MLDFFNLTKLVPSAVSCKIVIMTIKSAYFTQMHILLHCQTTQTSASHWLNLFRLVTCSSFLCCYTTPCVSLSVVRVLHFTSWTVFTQDARVHCLLKDNTVINSAFNCI